MGRLRALARAGAERRAPPAPDADPGERCDLCRRGVPEDHRHLLNLEERQIVCVCESCWALRSGDPELPPGRQPHRLAATDFELPDDVWASFRIPIGLAFFLHSSVTDCVVALYPSPAGATESELHFETWSRAARAEPGARPSSSRTPRR